MRPLIEKWMAVHAVLLLFSTVYFLFTYQIEVIGIAFTLSILTLYFLKFLNLKKTDFLFEAANIVTGFRWLLLVSLTFISLSNFQISFIAFLVLILDGIDGFLARKFKTQSGFGEYLDMETDAFYVLVLSCLLYQNGTFGMWIISLGLLRYLYFIVLLFFKAPQQKEERVFRARLIAVILMVALIAGFALPLTIAKPAIVISTILVFYSFGNSFWNILKPNS
jgi:phosphatidylglycerophosphate synthase